MKHTITTLSLLVFLFLTITSCEEGVKESNTTETEETTELEAFSIDTAVVYNISAIEAEGEPVEVMYNRVPGDPANGIIIRRKNDSGTHHETLDSGRVLRGQYIRGNKAFIYARYVPNTGCRETAWYSWVNPSVEVARFGDTFMAKSITRSYKAATGLRFKFGRWNKDYQKRWVDTTNRSRRRAGKMKFPKISPSDSLKDGQPYMPLPTPEGEGFLDAPFFGGRTSAGSMAERIMRKVGKVKASVEADKAPAPDSAIIRFTTRGRTYLYCIERGKKCLGFFNWTVVETDTIYVKWEQGGIVAGTKKKWKSGTTIKAGSRATVGPWQNCP